MRDITERLREAADEMAAVGAGIEVDAAIEAAALIEALRKERDEARADHLMVSDLLDAAVIDYNYARNLALEEAAKIAETCHPQTALLRVGIARAIRAAATKIVLEAKDDRHS